MSGSYPASLVTHLLAALLAARAEAETAREELQVQAEELEQQVEEAQALAEELEQSNVELTAALQAAESANEEVRRLFTENPLPMWIYDPDTLAFLDVNAAATAAYGYTREEFLGMTLRDIRPPEDVPRLLSSVRTEALVGRVVRDSHRHRKKDGTLCQVSLTAQDTVVQGRRARVVVAVDVTERDRVAEREHLLAEASRVLGASRDYRAALRAVAELALVHLAEWAAVDLVDERGAPAESIVVARESTETAAWAALGQATGRHYPIPADAPNGPLSVAASGETVYLPRITRAFVDALCPDVASARALGTLPRRALVIAPLVAHARQVGAITLVSSESRRFTQSDCAVFEEIGRHAGLAVDIAERYAAEQAARRVAEVAAEQTGRLQAVTAALSATLTPASVARVVVEHGIAALGGHAGAVAVLDETAKELVLLDAVGYGEDAARQYARVPLTANFPLADAVRTRTPIVLADSAERTARYPHLDALREANGSGAMAALPLLVTGRCIGALGINFPPGTRLGDAERGLLLAIAQQCAQALDRARLYEAEEAARTVAEAANRAKSDFLATMSHELRTPLNAIAGYVQLLADGLYGALSPAQLKVIGRVDHAQRHLLSLINDVLNFAKLEAGKVQYDVREVDVADVVSEAASMGEPQIASKGVALDVVACPPGPAGEAIAVWADRDKLRQVLLNLLSNASKFTPKGGRVTLACVAPDDGSDEVLIRITDTGIGIAADKQEAIFEPFVQVDTSRTREHHGTGLGLAISRDLARGMGGDLTVTSTPGLGSTFTVSLRLVVTADGERTDRRLRDDRRVIDRRRHSDRRGD